MFRPGLSARYRDGMRAFNAGRWDAALRAFQQALRAGGNSRDPWMDLSRFYAAESAVHLACEALERNVPQRALTWLEPARTCHPTHPEALFVEALARAALGDLEASARSARAVRAQAPEHAGTHLLCAALAHAQGRHDEALQEVERARAALGGSPPAPCVQRVVAPLAAGFRELQFLLRDVDPSTRRA